VPVVRVHVHGEVLFKRSDVWWVSWWNVAPRGVGPHHWLSSATHRNGALRPCRLGLRERRPVTGDLGESLAVRGPRSREPRTMAWRYSALASAVTVVTVTGPFR